MSDESQREPVKIQNLQRPAQEVPPEEAATTQGGFGADADIAALTTLVMMEASSSQNQDLKQIMGSVKSTPIARRRNPRLPP